MFLFGVALKNLWRRKIRSGGTVLGLAVAFAAMICFVGLSERLQQNFAEVLDRHQIDIVVSPKSQRMLMGVVDQIYADNIRQLSGVQHVMPVLADLTSVHEAEILGCPIQGWPIGSPLLEHLELIEGSLIMEKNASEVLLGNSLADKLEIGVGESIEIEAEDFQVVGIYNSGNSLENGIAIVPLPTLQTLLDRAGKVNVFLITLDDRKNLSKARVDEFCKKIESLRDADSLEIELKATPTSEFVTATRELGLVRASAWATSAIALLIGTITMFNTMAMSVFERTNEFGILRAIGWKPKRILSLIVMESLTLSIVGSAVGSLFAMAIVRALSQIPRAATLVDGQLPLQVFINSLLLALFIGLAAGLIPAIRGSLLRPTEALRHV